MPNLLPAVLDSRYTPIRQKEYHCVPACIQMILQKHGLQVPSQDELGYNLGIIVPPKKAERFSPVRVGTGSEASLGTQLQKPEYDFNTVAKRLGLGVALTCIPPQSFETPDELTSYLAEAEEADKDIVVCYDFASLYKNGKEGHVNLFDRVTSNTHARFIEPLATAGYEDYLWRQNSIEQLLRAMEVHSPWMGGVWDIELS